jgi:CBS domain containing-hemolysin-like protein
MTLILVLAFLILSISFLCSLLEAVFLSITPAYVQMEVQDNPKTGKLMEHLKENVDRPMSAILSLNTISHTAGAAGLGAMVHETFGNEFLTITSIILTLAVLIFSEFIPKILGTIYWRNLAPFAVYAIQVLIIILYPIVWMSVSLGKLFKRPDEPEITREEVIATAQMGADEGSLHIKESNIIKNLLMLDNIFASDIMTPRSVIFALDANLTVEDVFEKYKPIRFSRIPVFEGSLDNIIGMTHRYKIMDAVSDDHHDVKIRDLVIPINSVSEQMTVAAVIDYFAKKKEHMALDVDDYGVITGLVTLEDAIETLLGIEIVDELDSVADMRQFALEQWQQRKSQFRKT